MARPRSVDREQLLDTAERYVTENGAASLSFGTLAKAADLSKATVQSIFGTKENLLEALIGRWVAQEQSSFDMQLRGQNSPDARVRIHLHNTRTESAEVGRTVSTMVAALAGNSAHSVTMRDWYNLRIGDLQALDEGSRRRRIAYLAAEGAFLIRSLVGFEIGDAEWNSIFDDLEALVVEPIGASLPGAE